MAFVLADQLKYVTESRRARFRPARFRGILPIDNSVPEWATEVEYSRIDEHGEDPAVIGNGPVKNLPRPTISKESGTIKILELGYLYGYSDKEMIKADKQGIRLPPTLAIANQTKYERWLDSVAAGEKLATLGLQGLLNVASITPATAATKAAGGTTWAVATVDELINDVAQSIEAVETATLENMSASQVIIPPAQYWTLTRTLHDYSTESALTILQRMFPGVVFRSWQRCALADAAGTGPRMVTMATGEDVARMINPKELTDDQPIRVHGGVEIAQFGSTAGVLVETPDAIVYTDGL